MCDKKKRFFLCFLKLNTSRSLCVVTLEMRGHGESQPRFFKQFKYFTCEIQSCCQSATRLGLSSVYPERFVLHVNEDILLGSTYCCPAALGQDTWPSDCCMSDQWRTGQLPVWIYCMRWKFQCTFSALRWFEAFKKKIPTVLSSLFNVLVLHT